MVSTAVFAAALSLAAAVIAMLAGILLRTRRQLAELGEALPEILAGNGSRRLLAKPRDLTAPLVYNLNAIVAGYEGQLSALHRTDEANKQLMTSLAHDVRTPLTTLIGYLDAVHRGLVRGAEREEYLDTARKKAYDLKEYIDILFDWFRLNSHELALSMVPLDATELTRDILKDWVPVFEERALDFTIDIPEQPHLLRLDADGYTRVLNNLVQNVLAHSRASHIGVTLRQGGRSLSVCVSDNGVGISREDLPHIFDRLYKCDKARSEGGSGLGLAITRQMVEAMGGTITASSTSGQKTAFTLQFPLAQ